MPERVYCELNRVTVRGDAWVLEQSTFAVHESRIEGSITGMRFEGVHLHNTGVGAGMRLSGGVSVWIEDSTSEESVRLSDNLDTRVLRSQVTGDLIVRRAEDQVQFCGAMVGGDARFADNHGWVQIGGDLANCPANEVRGNLRVHHNEQQITVANNAVGQNLVCAANKPAPMVYANEVDGTARGQCGAGEAVDAGELGDTDEPNE